ncbi:acyl-CoA dehydrogenase family protein [Mycolicibacterium sp. XJ2546]
MGFDLTPTGAQHDLARRTHEFAVDVVRPVAAEYDARQEFPWPVLEEAATRGFYSPLFYRDLIGDPTGLSLPMFMEELFWGCAGIGLAVVMPALALSAIGQAASPEQMLQWAPECFGTPGDLKLAALAISEPEGGSDVRNLRTTARRAAPGKDADWIIDGHKMWIGNGGIANVHVVNAVVDEELGHKGQALFIVPGGTPGLELVRKLDKLGCRASHTAELKFDGVRIPADQLLGGQEKLDHKLAKAREASQKSAHGAKHSGSATLGTFEQTHPMVAAQALGIARAALEYATEYANRREAFGAPIIDNQGIAFPLAELATAIDGARLLTWRASWMAASGVPFERGEGSMCKMAASEVAVRATERAIQTMGGWGYIKDHPVEKWYRDAKLYTIFEGTSEIQRIVIANALGAADGKPPLHFDLEPTGGPFNRVFGRGTPLRGRAADAALSAKDRLPAPVMRMAMKVLRPPRK